MDNILETLAKVAVIAIAIFLFLGWRKGKKGCGCQKPAAMAMGPDVGGGNAGGCGMAWGGKRSWA